MLHRCRPFTRGIERVHQADRNASAERIVGGQTSPPSGSVVHVPTRVGAHGQSFEVARRQPRQRRAFGRGPPLEAIGALQVEAIQERGTVQRSRDVELSLRNGLAKLRHVTRNDRRIQSKLGGWEQQVGLGELRAKRVGELAKRRARTLVVALGPEQR